MEVASLLIRVVFKRERESESLYLARANEVLFELSVCAVKSEAACVFESECVFSVIILHFYYYSSS